MVAEMPWTYEEMLMGNEYNGHVMDGIRIVCKLFLIVPDVRNPGADVIRAREELKMIVSQHNKEKGELE